MRLSFRRSGVVGILNRIPVAMGIGGRRRIRVRTRGVNLNRGMNGLVDDPVKDPPRFMSRMVTDRFLSISLDWRGRVMRHFDRLVQDSVSPNGRNENRFRRQENPWLEGIELKPVFGLSFYRIQIRRYAPVFLNCWT